MYEVRSVSEIIANREKFSTNDPESRYNGDVKVSRIKLAWLNSPRDLRHTDKVRLLADQLKSYCENSSLAGYKYITENRRTWFERILWILLHLTMVLILTYLIWSVLQDYYNTPVVTVVESDHYPSNFLDWPGKMCISVQHQPNQPEGCDEARKAESSRVTNLPFDKILDLLHELGSLYESSFDVYYKNQDELDELLRNFYGGSYDLTQLMKELTPQCTDMLVRCRFRSENRICSELFSFRKTQDGFCCTFNYARESDDVQGPVIENRVVTPYKILRLDMLNGLTFLMDSSLDDYFFPILPIAGWKITIFNPGDYPDNTSGGVSDALISPGTENFLELDAVSFFSEPEVRRFAVDERKCIFKDEIKALYDGYTYSDCIVDCKVSDIWQTCGCRPFFFPKRDSRRVCNTSDVNCLHKFKSKWWSVLPHDIRPGSEESKTFNFISNESWSLRCKNCYPSCEDVHYYLQTSSVNLENNDRTFLDNISIVNQGLVHIFFSKYGTIRLKQDISYYWYELLSNIGGICGVFIGFSLISAVEFVYYVALSGVTLCAGIKRSRSLDDNGGAGTVEHDERSIYWDELAPRGHVHLESRRRTIASRR